MISMSSISIAELHGKPKINNNGKGMTKYCMGYLTVHINCQLKRPCF